jgi:hypothetical protein
MTRGLRATIITAIASIMVVFTAVPARADIADKRNDYNGDGISDIVAVWNADNCLYRSDGRPGGGFDAGALVGCGWERFKGALSAPGDLNQDGIGDLVSVDPGTGCMFRWLGTGSGGFGVAVQLACGWDLFWRGLHGAGDLNQDGIGDLISIRDDNGCLVRVLGNGSGGFQSRERIACAFSEYRDTMTGAGDNTGDGRPDLAGINNNTDDPCLASFQFTASGGLGAFAQIECGWGPYAETRNVAGMGDLDGDGNGDLVAIDSTNGRLRYWFGDGAGGYGRTFTYGSGFADHVLAS